MAFDLQPTLEGPLLRLRPLRADDWERLFAVASDPLIWEQHPASNRYEEDIFRDFFREAMEAGSAFVIIDRQKECIIGSSRFYAYDPQKSEIEIGWTFLARSYWGGSYNKELKQLMLQHAFRYVSRVLFLVGLQNWRSQRAMEKIGGVRTGFRANGTDEDSIVFEITSPTLE